MQGPGVHDIILSTAGEGSPLEPLLEDITAPFGSNRFRINVPSVVIPPQAAVALALTVNELATNAVKYGALSVPDGGVVVVGRRDAVASELAITCPQVRPGPAAGRPRAYALAQARRELLQHLACPYFNDYRYNVLSSR